MNNNYFVELDNNEIQEVNAGAVYGGVAGALLGFTGGTVALAGYAIANDGNISGKDCWHILSSWTLAGAYIGGATPF